MAAWDDHIHEHLAAVRHLPSWRPTVERWGSELAATFLAGGRLCVAGNGGSAAEAQHLTGELVGRYRTERQPLCAVALHAETSALTAIANDYGWEEAYARALLGLARSGDVLLLLSTSGRSANLVRCAAEARSAGITVWAFTGSAPNPLHEHADEAIAVPGGVPVVQELHLTLIHLLCAAVDDSLARGAITELRPYALASAGLRDKEERPWP
ncbi:MAG: SIS domain-containing protein [Candidatus Dormibacteraeota bacterium]|nr:SIS domain-containing protein [Candidatus Dormibacteraeota bacterium]